MCVGVQRRMEHASKTDFEYPQLCIKYWILRDADQLLRLVFVAYQRDSKDNGGYSHIARLL